MNMAELYDKTPVEKHSEIVVSGDRLYFDGEEFVIGGDGELRLARSQRGLEQKLVQIETKLGIK
jgi:hypothetical protein